MDKTRFQACAGIFWAKSSTDRCTERETYTVSLGGGGARDQRPTGILPCSGAATSCFDRLREQALYAQTLQQ